MEKGLKVSFVKNILKNTRTVRKDGHGERTRLDTGAKTKQNCVIRTTVTLQSWFGDILSVKGLG